MNTCSNQQHKKQASADVARAADSARVRQLETSLTQMNVALDEAKDRISQLQAAKEAAESLAMSAAAASSAVPRHPVVGLRGDSVLSLEAQSRALGASFLLWDHNVASCVYFSVSRTDHTGRNVHGITLGAEFSLFVDSSWSLSSALECGSGDPNACDVDWCMQPGAAALLLHDLWS
jgi:hypothetical protein